MTAQPTTPPASSAPPAPPTPPKLHTVRQKVLVSPQPVCFDTKAPGRWCWAPLGPGQVITDMVGGGNAIVSWWNYPPLSNDPDAESDPPIPTKYCPMIYPGSVEPRINLYRDGDLWFWEVTWKSARLENIARVCHEANRAYCLSLGDTSQPSWDDAPEWQRTSAMLGAALGTWPRQSHEKWLEVKRADGWTYGPIKDPVAKTHPCMVPYDELPREQQKKDELFCAIVKVLA